MISQLFVIQTQKKQMGYLLLTLKALLCGFVVKGCVQGLVWLYFRSRVARCDQNVSKLHHSEDGQVNIQSVKHVGRLQRSKSQLHLFHFGKCYSYWHVYWAGRYIQTFLAIIAAVQAPFAHCDHKLGWSVGSPCPSGAGHKLVTIVVSETLVGWSGAEVLGSWLSCSAGWRSFRNGNVLLAVQVSTSWILFLMPGVWRKFSLDQVQ